MARMTYLAFSHALLRSCLAMFVVLAIASCKPKLPAGIMSQGKLERVLYDYHLAQGMAENAVGVEGQNNEQRLYILHQTVLKKHRISQADFDSSMHYYCRDMEKMNEIYSHLTSRFEKEAEALGYVNARKDIYADLTDTGDTANVWADRKVFILKPNPIENLYAWEMECDSTWQENDDMLWRFQTLFVSKKSFPRLYADMTVRFTNDSLRSYTSTITMGNLAELRINSPRDWTPATIWGHLYMPLDKGNTDYMLAIVNQPSLIRFHKPKPKTPQGLSSDSLRADSLQRDSLVEDSTASDNRRLSPTEFRNQQPVDKKIQVVKKKPYFRPTNIRRGNRQRQRR